MLFGDRPTGAVAGARVVILLGGVVNGWRALTGESESPILSGVAALALGSIAVGLRFRSREAWLVAVGMTLMDTLYVLVSPDAGLFGSVLWPVLGLAFLVATDTRRSVWGTAPAAESSG